MRFKRQFIVFIVAWAVLTLPGFVLGLVWAGGDLTGMLPSSELHLIDLIVWVISMAWLFSPLLLAPIGIERRKKH